MSQAFSMNLLRLAAVVCWFHSAAFSAFVQTDPGSGTASVWKEIYTFRKPAPTGVAFSKDGKTLLAADATGELMNFNMHGDIPTYRWMSKVKGTHPAVAYSPDGKIVYATMVDGVVLLDAESGKEKSRIEEKKSDPVAIAVFPVKPLNESAQQTKVVFGSVGGYFVKFWVTAGRRQGAPGTISTTTGLKGKDSVDAMAVPLAVDPLGRSAIMTGPIDATGQITGVAGKNVLWAYVCGDYDEGAPVNRTMKGHAATVVSAAWSKEGSVAVTGDAEGRVIEWNATAMKEAHRRELGGRVAALAVSSNGRRLAAYVVGKQGRVFVWNAGEATSELRPIHTEIADLSGPNVTASLDFSPDGNRLAGCASDMNWRDAPREKKGSVHVWEIASSPKTQAAPRFAWENKSGSHANCVIPSNNMLLRSASKEGALDIIDIDDGKILSRMSFGDVLLRKIELSPDRRWMAIEQFAKADDETFDVIVRSSNIVPARGTVSKCEQLLGLAPGGTQVAVVRDCGIELWSTEEKPKLIRKAPFRHTRIHTARFSPDGNVLAISDANTLVLWRWQEDKHERIELNRKVASLAFSPDGRFLAEGPEADKAIHIRDLSNGKKIRTLTVDHELSVPDMAFTQGGRVLIACDKSVSRKQSANKVSRARIFLWDTTDGSLAHELKVPGLPGSFDVSPNELWLVARVAGSGGTKLLSWRLDGRQVAKRAGNAAPAAAGP